MEKNTIKKAGAIIINRDLKSIALVYRPTKDDWTFPKGRIEDGEIDVMAMKREILEETGMVVEVKDILPDMEYIDDKNRNISVKMFLAIFFESKPEDKVGDEKTEWIHFDEVAQKLSYRNLRQYFLKHLTLIKKIAL